MTKEEHQKILFGPLFNGLDKPLKFTKVSEDQRGEFLKIMQKSKKEASKEV